VDADADSFDAERDELALRLQTLAASTDGYDLEIGAAVYRRDLEAELRAIENEILGCAESAPPTPTEARESASPQSTFRDRFARMLDAEMSRWIERNE
jgi:hypothetical protein